MADYPDHVRLEDAPCPNGCPSCDEVLFSGRDLLHNVPGQFFLVRCRACGLERTNPRPTAETIGAYYPAEYGPYSAKDSLPAVQRTDARARLQRRLGLTDRSLPDRQPGHLLEIGCASGQYMLACRALGWTVEGIEFSDSAAQRARDSGLSVQTGTVEDARMASASVDVIAAWMVLEHLHQPLRCLKKMRDWIRDDGYLLISVPDAHSPARALFREFAYDLQLPTHLYHYTPETLGLLLAKSGWRVERVRWQRNCMTLLNSLVQWAELRGHRRLTRVATAICRARRFARIRQLLGWVLGFARMSGRVEIWARPERREESST